MTLSLSKGETLSLTKTVPGLTKMLIGTGWDPQETDDPNAEEYDLDASAFMLTKDGKVRSNQDVIYYGMHEDKTKPLISACGSIYHHGDNRTGEGDGDDEKITIDFSKVPADVEKISIVVTIHEADKRKQNFGQVDNSFIRLVNEETGDEELRYDLNEDFSTQTAVIFAELYRYKGEWKVRAIAQGYTEKIPLGAMFTKFGVNK